MPCKLCRFAHACHALYKEEPIMATEEEYKDWINRLHSIAEEFHKAGIRPEDQCALRWSANIVAEKIKQA